MSDISLCSRSTIDPEWKIPSTVLYHMVEIVIIVHIYLSGSSADFELDDLPTIAHDDNTENSATNKMLENSPIIKYGDNTENPITK